MDLPVNSIKGIGEKKARLLSKIGINTVGDILYCLPRGYEQSGRFSNISGLSEGRVYTVAGYVSEEPKTKRIRKSLSVTAFSIYDETGSVEAVFFNRPYVCGMAQKGEKIYLSGKVRRYSNRLSFTNPALSKKQPDYGGLLPVYSLTAGLSQKSMRLAVKSALGFVQNITEIFPDEFRKKHGLSDIKSALSDIHFPKSAKALEPARKRIAFEEFLLFSIALGEKERSVLNNAYSLKCDETAINLFFDKLRFSPTAAQLRVMREIESDLQKTTPMNRLVQGDVGSGKTAAAFFAMHICVQSGFQCALMAPTEVLAEQHFNSAQRLFFDMKINIELITGGMTASRRKIKLENIAAGQADIIIGTHALLYDNVRFARLGLIITDEQHRFGVSQRAALESKSAAPHTLVMSATPIPRSLALILYGETNLSVIDEMPPGRKPVKTFCVPEKKREAMYKYIEKEIAEGALVFVVCPLVEDNDYTDIRSSQQVYEHLSKRFAKYGVLQLHGRMDSKDKNEVITKFKERRYAILVSTTVIEVGVDVTNATIMIIENAERFGLASLHQLRGRVGRGDIPSYCFLMSEKKDNERLKILCKTNDGFLIAEEDLRLRGPGQLLGGRQSGGSDIYMSGLVKDYKLLEKTRGIAANMVNTDFDLYNKLSSYANERFSKRFYKTTIN
ncbi:MAG: ATP-dependent DNA helicase RecG [Christensenellales bacterium]